MDKKHENINEAEAVVEEVVETEVAEAVEETTDVETEAASEAEAVETETEAAEDTTEEPEAETVEEAAEEETEPEDTAAEEPEAEPVEAVADEPDPEETQIITNEMKEALEETEAEEIADAKIQAGINEAAEEFKVEQELARTMEGNKKMEEKNREEATVKTVYIKEKQKTGWWKVVMLILTILITLTFAATALFAGLGCWQLYRIAEKQETMEVPAQTVPDPYYYGGGSQNGNNGGYYDDSYGNSGQNDYDIDNILDQYGIDEDFDWNDIEQYFNNGNNNGNNNGGNNNGNNNGSNSQSNWRDDVSNWLTDLFGVDEGNGATQGF